MLLKILILALMTFSSAFAKRGECSLEIHVTPYAGINLREAILYPNDDFQDASEILFILQKDGVVLKKEKVRKVLHHGIGQNYNSFMKKSRKVRLALLKTATQKGCADDVLGKISEMNGSVLWNHYL